MPYHDTTSTSSPPLSPRAPSLLPQWLHPARPRAGAFSKGRLKSVAVASCCIILGWAVTSGLGPVDDSDLDFAGGAYDLPSPGVLTESSGYGTGGRLDEERPGVVYSLELENLDVEKDPNEPSVKGALQDLHHAVSDKLQSWNPYRLGTSVKPASHKNKSIPWDKEKQPGGSWNEKTSETQVDGLTEDLGAKTRIGKCTILFNSNGNYERALRSHELHNRQHGYRLNILRQGLMDDVWSKPAYVLSLLLRELSKPDHERLEWLMWVDADTVILNPFVPIDVFLPPPGPEFEDVHLMYSNDWNGLNNGVFPVRVNQWAVELFSAIVAYRHYQPDADLTFRDQSAMNALLHDPQFEKNVVEAPQRWFNAYQGEHDEVLAPYQIRRGDLLVHFAGLPDRDARMQYWLEREEQHLEDWEIPLKSTSYPTEARDFWNSQREARRNHQQNILATQFKATQLLTETDAHMTDYGERLDEGVKEVIRTKQAALRTILETPVVNEDLDKIEAAIQELLGVSGPIIQAINTNHRLLINSAHEAIFAGEKSLSDGGFSHGTTSSEMEQLSATIKFLKSLVMLPEEQWDKNGITVATNAVIEARARLESKASEVNAVKVAAEEEAKPMAYNQAKKFLEEQLAADQIAALATGSAVTPYLASEGLEPIEAESPVPQSIAALVTATGEVPMVATQAAFPAVVDVPVAPIAI